jgi:ABC-2 type transport system ATP-binding protein
VNDARGGAAHAIAGGPPIEVRNLAKVYGDIVAVDHVSLTVGTGDVFGYLGPNGAGKTTSLRMMLGLIRPTSGEVRLFGRDPCLGADALRGVAGFVEAPRFYPYLSGRANLELLAGLDRMGVGARRTDAVLDVVELADRARDRVGGYSHGMRQRLGIAAALLRDPRLLLLDEPATGLDPAGMRDMRELVRRLADSGITIVLSSHLLNEVEDLCNRVAIIRSGRVAYEGTLGALRQDTASTWHLHTTDDDRALAISAAQPGVSPTDNGPWDRGQESGIFLAADGEQAISALSVVLVDSGLGIVELHQRVATLEDLFFSLTEDRPPVPEGTLTLSAAGR